jgi:DNA-binding transcriptional LysR family regulator
MYGFCSCLCFNKSYFIHNENLIMQLDDLRLIEQLSRSRSLAQTARALDQTPAAVSLRLKRMEQKLGASLVQRTTRTLVLTEQGQRLVQAAREALAIVDEIPQRVGGAHAPLAGHLQVAAPFGFARAYIAPAMARFRALHPAVQCSLQLSEHPVGELDRANLLVIQVGILHDSGLIAHAICDNARWLVASPYIRRIWRSINALPCAKTMKITRYGASRVAMRW